MKSKLLPSAAICVVTLLSGCGTLGSAGAPGGQFGVYSGTKASAEGQGTKWDVPLSLVADTILLPITVPLEISRKIGSSGDKQQSPPESK